METNKYLENKLLLISINFTPKTSHSCQKEWYTRFSRYLKFGVCFFFSFPGNDGQVPCQICQSDVNSGHSESMSKDVLISPRSKYLLLVRSDENGGFGQIKKIGKQWFFSTES